MKNKLALLLPATAAAVFATFSAPVMAQSAMDKPAGMATVAASGTATVTKIDKTDRWITLKMADGSLMDIQAGPEVKNFAQIKVGDIVTANREETMAIEVVPAGQAPPNATTGTSIVSAPPGSKPMGVMVDKTVVSGKITDIDSEKRLVTIVGPAGNSHTIAVGPNVSKFNGMKTGDNVVLTMKTATVIEVNSPAKGMK